MKMTKKGELTSNQLITIIILIISFAIILAFFFMLSLRSTIDKETCRNSVIMRGALPFGKDAVSLKCQAQDVCLSLGGECDVQRKDMVTVKVNDENELTEEMVNLLWDCWWMMGEGNVDYAPSTVGYKQAYCSICSNVYFDKKIQEKYKDGIPYSNLYNFMKSTKVPNQDETYMNSIYGANSIDTIRDSFLKSSGYDIYSDKIDSSKEYVVVTSIIKSGIEGFLPNLAIAGASAGIGKVSAIIIVSKLTVKGAAVGSVVPVIGTVGGAVIGTVAGIGALTISSKIKSVTFTEPRYLEFSGEELKSLKCKEYVSEG